MKVAIISSCYGAYDLPRRAAEQITDHDVEYLMVTDQPDGWEGWTTVVEPRPLLHPRVAAKHAKFLPGNYTDAQLMVWVDAGSEIGPGLVEWVAGHVRADSWSMFAHPERQSILEEVAASRAFRKYDAAPVEAQAAHYLSQGYPESHHLWATGLIAHHQGIRDGCFGADWLAEVVRWTYQDQISFAYLAWAHGLQIRSLGAGLWTNPHIRFANHTAKD